MRPTTKESPVVTATSAIRESELKVSKVLDTLLQRAPMFRREFRDDFWPTGRARRAPVAEHRTAGREAGRTAPAGDDVGGEAGPARQPLGGQRHGRDRDACRGAAQRRPHAGRLRGGRVRLAGGRKPARAWPPHSDLGQRASERRGRRGRADPPARGGAGRIPVGRPGPGPRGVPDGLHDVRRDRLPHRARLGRDLLDIILPTFETAIATAGAGSVMSSYSDIDGLPAGADPWLFTEVLRDEWGFTGTVVSDYWAVPFLATMHRVA